MCLFCSFVSRAIPVSPVYEDDDYIVLDDIHPKSRIHMLLIPKRHIATISDMEDIDQNLIGGLFVIARNLAREMSIPGYKLQFNVGKDGGQEIMHVHLHMLAD
ncbi:MAG: HIT domain-containing protein [Candidatus Gracilibacteria bacterium]|nr:HIT domain-containing protein [Candidatus Gracilibacteria bacterium]